ncbi:Protein FAR1-RELATED SEQUENCE 5 [Glycine soja]|nr:Protein FAR1-RELATED SEQUENCE 5 [Glycine soja]
MEFEPLSLSDEVIEFDMIGLGDDAAIDTEHPVEDDEDLVNIDNSPATAFTVLAAGLGPHIAGGDTNLEPCQGMEFESEEAAKAFYNSYARRVGFSTRVSMSRRSRRDGSIIQRSFVCAKEGFRVEREKHLVDGRVKRPRAETRVGCKAMLVVKIQDSGRWVVSSFLKEHNHELVPPDKALKYADEGINSPKVYDVALSALLEAASKVALATKNGGRQTILNGTCEEDLHQSNEVTTSCSDSPIGSQQSSYKVDPLAKHFSRVPV